MYKKIYETIVASFYLHRHLHLELANVRVKVDANSAMSSRASHQLESSNCPFQA